MNNEELAWAAGFFDGEGYIGCQCSSPSRIKERGKYYHLLHLKVNQAHPFVLERFVAAIGIGRVAGPYTKKSKTKPNNKDTWEVQLYADNARMAVERLRPWLSPVKIAQTDQAIHCNKGV